MQDHVKVYIEEFGYSVGDWIACEVCEAGAVDIHHIECRGMGGGRKDNRIENLMALCRSCHEEYGDKKVYKEMLKELHGARINSYRAGLGSK